MAISSKREERALTSDELTLVSQSRHPALQNLSDSELSKLTRLLRERRDRAQSTANQQRRELRRKGEPKGAKPSAGDVGNRLKARILATAVARLNNESTRRKNMAAHLALRASAKRALALKKESNAASDGYNTRQAHEGMRAIASRKYESLVNPMERGRLRKAKAVAQAKKDARQAEASAG